MLIGLHLDMRPDSRIYEALESAGALISVDPAAGAIDGMCYCALSLAGPAVAELDFDCPTLSYIATHRDLRPFERAAVRAHRSRPLDSHAVDPSWGITPDPNQCTCALRALFPWIDPHLTT